VCTSQAHQGRLAGSGEYGALVRPGRHGDGIRDDSPDARRRTANPNPKSQAAKACWILA